MTETRVRSFRCLDAVWQAVVDRGNMNLVQLGPSGTTHVLQRFHVSGAVIVDVKGWFRQNSPDQVD